MIRRREFITLLRDVRSIWLVKIEFVPADGTNTAAEIRGSRHAPWQLCSYATQLRVCVHAIGRTP